MSRPKISVVMVTARDEYPYHDIPNTPLFFPTLNSLLRQTFQDFELVIVDCLHGVRPSSLNRFEVPVGREVRRFRPKPSPYLSEGFWAVCTSFNTGLVHAEGELVQIIPDSVEFKDDYLERVWRWHQAGLYPLTLTHYFRGPEVAVRDSREHQMGSDYKLDPPWEWTYGLIALPLEAFLEVNGYDEAFDGKKSLEDPDLGLRLRTLNGRSKMVLDKGLFALEHDHGDLSQSIIRRKEVACCNWAILKLHEKQGRVRVNDRKFDEDELAFIRETSEKWPCTHGSGEEYDFSQEVGGFDWWARNVPVFDLRELRERARP